MFFSKKKKLQKRREGLCKEADIFVQGHYVRERNSERCKYNTLSLKSDPERDKVNEWYEAHENPTTYTEVACAYFEDSKKDEATLCERVLLEKSYFSKLSKLHGYIPAKGEAITVCFAFHLSYEASRALLRTAGYAFSNSEKSDLIVRYFLENENYSINDLNFVLHKLCDIKLKDIS